MTAGREIGDASIPSQVWDLPVRLTHWGLVGLVATCWATAQAGQVGWHRLSGYGVLWLVLFRIYWAFVGSTSARFSHFLRGPRTVLAYARTLLGGRGTPSVGHNPLGGWNVALLLFLMALQTALGLFSVDEFGLEAGPLAGHVSFELGRRIAGWHETVFNLLLAAIALHVCAVTAYLVIKRDNLIAPMLTGLKTLDLDQAIRLRPAPASLALAGFAGSAALVAVLAFLL